MINENIWSLCLPHIIKFGEGVAEEIGYEAKRLGGTNALLVTDEGVAKVGIAKQVEQILSKEGLSVSVWDKVIPEPPIDVYRSCLAFSRDKEFDVVVGLGGGSSMDVAKCVRMILKYGGDPLDYVAPPTGKGKRFPGFGLPMIAVTTTSGTASEVSPAAVISLPDRNLKVGISDNNQRPEVAIVDPLLTVAMPPSVTAASGMDALAHAAECYTTRRYDAKPRPKTPADRAVYNGGNPITDIWAAEAIRLISVYLRRAVNNGYDIEARSGMSMASLLAGMAFTNGGVTAVHAMAYPVGGTFHTAHGVTNALLLPYVMKFNAAGNPDRFADVAEIMGENVEGLSVYEAARKAAYAARQLALDIGIPSSLTAFGCTEQDAPKLAQETLKIQRILSGNPRPLSVDDLENLFLQAIRGEL